MSFAFFFFLSFFFVVLLSDILWSDPADEETNKDWFDEDGFCPGIRGPVFFFFFFF
jgi:hypothetical protein